jgi:hypothetical protein
MYPGFNQTVRGWFLLFQAKHPEAHISCAGRGLVEQEEKKAAGRSNAPYGRSAHNYNCAIDVFIQIPGKDLYDLEWFEKVLSPEIPFHLKWYGAKGSGYYELPHIELRNWRELLTRKEIALVEKRPGDIA